MGRFIFLRKNQLNSLPKTAGVYSFNSAKELLYIGKANNIKERVGNHFSQPNYRDNLFLEETKKVGYLETGSEIEALLLEAELIKKYQPKYNIAWRDDKNYFYVGVSSDERPRVFITHQKTEHNDLYIGPFTDGRSLKKTLRLLRRVFPYYTAKHHSPSPCLWCHLKLCPGPNPDIKGYKNNIKNLISVLRGKKKTVLLSLRKEMKTLSESQYFEKAGQIRDQIFALEKTISNAKIFEPLEVEQSNWEKTQDLLKRLLRLDKKTQRIEGYDVSNIQGKTAVASMVVFINGEPAKSLYRKFKMRLSGKPNDTAMIRETLSRRMLHNEWPYPDLILMDGGKAQLNAALKTKNQRPKIKNIKFLAIAKKKNELFMERKQKPVLLKSLPREVFNLILQLRDEAHRFAVTYHRKLKKKELLG